MAKTPHRFGRPSTQKRRELYRVLMLRDGPCCSCCNKRFTDTLLPTIEHLVPISQGGRNLPSNLVLLCAPCNEGRDHGEPGSRSYASLTG